MNIRPASGAVLLVCLALGSCATRPGSTEPPAHDNLDGTLFMQASAEYAAAVTSIYAAASAALSEIANAHEGATGGLAVVLDIDETVLDNSLYQAQLIKDQSVFERESWDRWIALRRASAVPGVVDFIRTSQSLGVHVAFITNRACRNRPGVSEYCPQKQDTLVNLADVGIDIESTTLFLRGESPPVPCEKALTEAEQSDGTWSGDKTSRRACVGLDYDIVMLFGDQLGDFTEVEDRTFEKSGRHLAAQFNDHWGKIWFMLPNPTYGDWKPRTPALKHRLVKGID